MAPEGEMAFGVCLSGWLSVGQGSHLAPGLQRRREMRIPRARRLEHGKSLLVRSTPWWLGKGVVASLHGAKVAVPCRAMPRRLRFMSAGPSSHRTSWTQEHQNASAKMGGGGLQMRAFGTPYLPAYLTTPCAYPLSFSTAVTKLSDPAMTLSSEEINRPYLPTII